MTEPAPLPAPAAITAAIPAWEGTAEALLQRATALGRRDGLAGPADRPAELPGWRQAELLRRLGPGAVPPLLLLALRQCYAAGHRHGSDVRRESRRRRA
ncbi:hypothetical protein [Pseudoroseomonas cervicalis]|uniref:hypothetical protein n=1 Tax=Teichococcus cervicalis TaxID=204525 RepID=UPI0022F1A521|nr:hypothetical protein [Pseudoroseomonas cervicalis]WBV45554.1 hypothetical protein PFY06_21315 [Pseudoroseomonas cervicalis]